MRQRVMIAMALSCNASLFIADEPTTALDVTIQAQILELMRELKEKENKSLMLITHDMGVVAEMADDVMVMYAGKEMEYGDVRSIFKDPLHPYTRGLLKSIPRLDQSSDDPLFNIPGHVPGSVRDAEGMPFLHQMSGSRQTMQGAGAGALRCKWKTGTLLEVRTGRRSG